MTLNLGYEVGIAITLAFFLVVFFMQLSAKKFIPFDDIRLIQEHLKKEGISLISEAESNIGPANIMLTDPDGNTILMDQHR
jgi:hypothetical protein